MKKLTVLVLMLLMAACACAEGLDLDSYPDYTGEPVSDSADIIQKIMSANTVRDIIAENGGIRQDIYSPDGDTMTFYRGDEISIVDGVEIRRIIEESSADIYIAAGTAYMIENGAILTMPAENLPVTLSPLDDFLFVYDETEVVLAVRDWENGEVVLTHAADMYLEYFLDENYAICAIKTFEGDDNACTAYITVTHVPAADIPSFIIREAQK